MTFILDARWQGGVQQWQQRGTVLRERLNRDSVTQRGNAQGAVDQQQALKIVFTVNICGFQQQRRRTRTADLMKQRGWVVAIDRLAGQQFEVWFGCLHYVVLIYSVQKKARLVAGWVSVCILQTCDTAR